MSEHNPMPGAPREVQRAADEVAEELWQSLVHSAPLPRDVDELAAMKPDVMQVLRLAYIRGAFDKAKLALDVLASAARRR